MTLPLRPEHVPQGLTAAFPAAPEQPDTLGEFRDAYLVTRKQIDPVQLQEDLIRRLGQDVTITLRMPSDTEPGYLRVLDVRNGLPLDVDQAVIDEVLEENTSPETNGQRFLREFDGSDDIEGQLLALRDYVARDVLAQEHQAAAQGRMHAQVTRLHQVRLADAQRFNPITGEPIAVRAL